MPASASVRGNNRVIRKPGFWRRAPAFRKPDRFLLRLPHLIKALSGTHPNLGGFGITDWAS
jgi:hypothetical protein